METICNSVDSDLRLWLNLRLCIQCMRLRNYMTATHSISVQCLLLHTHLCGRITYAIIDQVTHDEVDACVRKTCLYSEYYTHQKEFSEPGRRNCPDTEEEGRVFFVHLSIGCREESVFSNLITVTVTVTVTDDLLNTKVLSPVSRRLSQPVQSPNYMQCRPSIIGEPYCSVGHRSLGNHTVV